MRKIRLVLLSLTIIISFTSCQPNRDANAESPHVPYTSEISDSVYNSTAIPQEDKSETNKSHSKKYFEAWEKDSCEVSCYDFETAYVMCTQALIECSEAYASGENIDFSKYIKDKNLTKYMKEKIKSDHHYDEMNLVSATGLCDYDINNDMIYFSIGRAMVDDNHYGSYSYTNFIVKNSNGRLVIAEWYDGDKFSFDYSARGRLNIKNVVTNNNEGGKTYWDDLDEEALWEKIASLKPIT